MQSQNQPGNVIEEAINAVEKTIANPTPEQIVADIQTALNLFLQFKSSLNGLHPTVLDVIKFLL